MSPTERSSESQALARASADALGLPALSLAELREVARRVPFEWGFIGVSLLSARLWEIWMNGRAQLALMQEVYGDVPLIHRYKTFLAKWPTGVLLSQQQLYAAQRLLIQEAREASYDEEVSEDEEAALSTLMLHSADLVDRAHGPLTPDKADLIDVVAFIVQSAAVSARPAPVNEFGRFFDIFGTRARELSDPRVPLDEWAKRDVGLALEEQLAGGFGFSSMATPVIDGSVRLRILEPNVLQNTKIADAEPRVVDALSAPRHWYQERFAKGDQSERDVVWELHPFLRRPFLQLASGKLVLSSRAAMSDWIGFGIYDRLRETAKTEPAEKGKMLDLFGQVYGNLVEGYALDVVRSVFPRGTVFGDQPYGEGLATPDIAINLGDDLVLIEVRSGFLSPWFRTSGDIDEFRTQLDRLVLAKLRQLSDRILDFKAGKAPIPSVDHTKVRRIWPILITASMMITEHFWALIDDQIPDGLQGDGVQQVVIGDVQDLELLMALVEEGRDVIALLEARQSTSYGTLELTRWILEEEGASPTSRPTLVRRNWERAVEAMAETLWPGVAESEAT